MTTNFEVAALFTVSPSDLHVEKRASVIASEVVTLHMEKDKSGWKHDASNPRERDTNKHHQIDPSRGSSMVATMPSVKRAITKANPFPSGEALAESDTSETWKAYQAVPALVWEVLSKSESPMTAAQVAGEVAKLDHKAPARWFDLTVSDTLRDLRIVGLAEANTVKSNAKRTLWRAVDPASITLAETADKAADKAESKPTPRKARAKASN